MTAGDDEVEAPGTRLSEHPLDELRRVLEIAVHHADPGASREPHPLDDRAAQPVAPAFGRSLHQPDWPRGGSGDAAPLVGGAVVGVVDEDDLELLVRQDHPEPRAEGADVALLVAGRHDDRNERDHPPGRVAVPRGWLGGGPWPRLRRFAHVMSLESRDGWLSLPRHRESS